MAKIKWKTASGFELSCLNAQLAKDPTFTDLRLPDSTPTVLIKAYWRCLSTRSPARPSDLKRGHESTLRRLSSFAELIRALDDSDGWRSADAASFLDRAFELRRRLRLIKWEDFRNSKQQALGDEALIDATYATQDLLADLDILLMKRGAPKESNDVGWRSPWPPSQEMFATLPEVKKALETYPIYNPRKPAGRVRTINANVIRKSILRSACAGMYIQKFGRKPRLRLRVHGDIPDGGFRRFLEQIAKNKWVLEKDVDEICLEYYRLKHPGYKG